MKVLQINSVCGIGSTGRIATDIHKNLIEQGHESYIAYGRDLPMNCENTIRIGTQFSVYSHVLKTRVLDKHGFGSKRATIDFIENIKKIKPDIIHIHNLHGYYINIEVLFEYIKSVNIPIVWTLHDCWSFTGHCTHFEYAGCECWKTDGLNICIQKRGYPTSYFINNSKENFKRKKNTFSLVNNLVIVTPSNWLADLVSKSFLMDYPTKVINNGIDLDKFKIVRSDFRERHNLKNKYIILGVANVWSKRKGFDDFIKLSEIISDEYAIVLVGVNNENMKRLPKNVTGILRTNSIEELAEVYSAADIFVNPTYEDTFPTTNLESLACGTLVITYDTGGSPEALNKNSGYKVKKGDIDGIMSLIKYIKIKGYKSDDCLERANLFDKDRMLSKYIKVYKELLNE